MHTDGEAMSDFSTSPGERIRGMTSEIIGPLKGGKTCGPLQRAISRRRGIDARDPRLRVLVVHDYLASLGGGPAVAAWTLQALRDANDVSLLTWAVPDVNAVNRFYGTSLKPTDFRVHTAPGWARTAFARLPVRLAQVRKAILLRECRRLDAANPYDVLLHTADECAFHRPGIQYVHYPYELDRISSGQPHAAIVQLNRTLTGLLWPYGKEDMQRNLTLVNSEFTAQAVRSVWGIRPQVVHPPVFAGPGVPWEERAKGIVWVGRFLSSKHPFDAVEIVRRLRAAGHDLDLHMAAIPADRTTLEKLQAQARREAGWLHIHVGMARRDLSRLLASNRFGLHTMPREHFGIAVAELLRAGCVPFAHASGGPCEILDHEDRLLFSDIDQAVAKIDALLGSPGSMQDVRRRLTRRAEAFTAERFMEDMRRIVSAFARGECSSQPQGNARLPF